VPSTPRKKSHQLLLSQKNELLADVELTALDPADFYWHTRVSWQNRGAPVLVHRPTSFYFLFEFARGNHLGEYSPGEEIPVVRANLPKWADVRSVFLDWLDNVEREYGEPDLWAQIGKAETGEERALAGATGPGPPGGEDRLTEEERQAISDQLHAIRELIVARTELTAVQLESLDERLLYIEKASCRMTRRDVATIIVGTIVSMSMEHIIDGGLTLEVLRLAAQGLGHLFGSDGIPELPAGRIPPV
jgi:hypothetical protein